MAVHINIVLLDLLLVTFCLCNFNILNIKPTSSPELPSCYCISEWPCKTLDEFTDNSTVYLNNKDNLIMIFFPGEHNLTKELLIKGTKNLTMVGADSCSPMFGSVQQSTQNTKITLYDNLTLEGPSNLTMSGLIIDGQNVNIVTLLTVGIADDIMVNIGNVAIARSGLLLGAQNRLFSKHEGVLTLSNLNFVSSTVMFDFEKTSKITLKNISFFLGSTGNAITFCGLISYVSMQNITIVTLNGSDTPVPSLKCTGIVPRDFKRTCDLVISFSIAFVEHLNRSLTLTISDSSFTRSFGAGICIPTSPEDRVWLWFLTITIENSLISSHTEGGMDIETGHVKNLTLSLVNTTISSNTNRTSTASALSIKKFSEDTNIVMEVINTIFDDNEHLLMGEQQSTVFLLGITNITFDNCQFINNYGSAIRAISMEEFRFVGQTIFRNNTGYRGGALYLYDSVIDLEENSTMIFENNLAKDIGGAIYIDNSNSATNFFKSRQCFLRLLNYDRKSSKCRLNCPENQECYELRFINNSAANGGESIFGSIRKPCDLEDLNCAFQTINDKNYSSLASTPTRVCLCQEQRSIIKRSCENTSLIFTSKSVYPGEEFHVEAVLVGDMFGTGTGSVYAQFMYPENKEVHNKASLKPSFQYSQRVDNYKICQRLNYAVYSYKSEEVLVLTTNDATVVSFTDKKALVKDNNRPNIDILLTTPVYINLTLLPCPPGFHLKGSPPGCDCVPVLSNNDLRCSLSKGIGYVYRNGTIWIKLNRESTTIQKHCPFEYCRDENSGVSFNNSDSQCTVNRAGILCGACRSGFSLALGSNKCLSCPNNNNIALLIFFAAAGFLLVTFIKILNITVSQGTINGLIFYANIIWAYESIFFPSDDTSLGKAWFLKTFIAWLNLDLGIETCFAQGLTAYAKTWLQFVFPLYICTIVVVMIFSAHYSKFMTRLLGNNSVQVLATLFLLIYAKLLRTIIIALVPAYLYTYQNDGELIKRQMVWAFDGNLSYGCIVHLILSAVALLTLLMFGLPYTAVLLLFQLLRRGTSLKLLQWLIKLTPFFETYFGPLKTKHFYWVGLLLLVRCFLFAVFILTYSSVPSAGLLAILVTFTFLLTIFAYTGRVYRNRLLSLFEYSFFVNLQVLTATLFFAELTKRSSRELIVCISVGVAFTQFVGIVIYHTWLRISKVLAKRCVHLKRKESRAGEDDELKAYQLMDDHGQLKSEDIILKDICKESFLEDHAVDADALLTDIK